MALTVILKTLFDTLDEESKAKCGNVDFAECAKRETELPAKQREQMTELASILMEAHNKQQLTVPGLFVRLERLPELWQKYVKDTFCHLERREKFPELFEFRKEKIFRESLHELIQEVEVAYNK